MKSPSSFGAKMKRLPLIAVGVIGLSLLAPAVAVADEQGFYNDLAMAHLPTGPASLEFGYAICGRYATSVDQSSVMWWLYNLGYSPKEAALWTVFSVDDLCPQFKDRLGQP